jgi:hypothetical protein
LLGIISSSVLFTESLFLAVSTSSRVFTLFARAKKVAFQLNL